MSSQLVAALKAGIPVIRVMSRDRLNDAYIVSSICKKILNVDATQHHKAELQHITAKISMKTTTKKRVVVLTEMVCDLKGLFDAALELGFQVVVITRSEKEVKERFLFDAYDAGELVPLKEHIIEVLAPVVEKDKIEDFLFCFKGLQLKDVPIVLKLTFQRDKSITQEGLLKTRSQLITDVKGVSTVDTELFFYEVDQELEDWVQLNKKVFWECPIQRLVPRGVLFSGQAGTGKTLGAKYMAAEFGVPLIQFDLGGMLGKYVGESEEQLSAALSAIELLAPCFVLMDEVEKVFATSGDSGTTSRLLSKILWWLQEHEAKIVTVMTTNDKGKLPEELYRAGRIDQTFEFSGISGEKAILSFLQVLNKVWEESEEVKTPDVSGMPEEIIESWNNTGSAHRSPSHAFVVQFYENELKKLNYLKE